jgi:hypothetical protein
VISRELLLKNFATLALNSRWKATLSNPAGLSVQMRDMAAASSGEHGARKAKWPAGAQDILRTEITLKFRK